MRLKQHPGADELEAYILNRLQPPASVRIAKHVLSCPECFHVAALVEEHVERTPDSYPPGAFARLSQSMRRVWYEPASALACGFATILVFGSLGLSLFQPRISPVDAASAVATARVYGPVPDVESPMVEPAMPVEQASVRVSRRRPPRRAVKPFFAPDESRRAHAVGYLLPPPRPVQAYHRPATYIQLASLPTEIEAPVPSAAPAKKRHPLIRFFGVFAKPFRPDRT